MNRLMKPEPEDYELRFIIYKVEGIPLGERSAIDIYLRASFDPGGWLTDSIEKETDNHNGSEDGSGEFNWRMLFPF